MKLLAVSDLRVQPLPVLERLIQEVAPDLVLYGGDDVGRFGTVPTSVYVDVARTLLEAGPGEQRHPGCAWGVGIVHPWSKLERVPEPPMASGFDIWLGPEDRNVPVVRAVPRLVAPSGELTHQALGALLGRWGPPSTRSLHEVHVGDEAWVMWLHRRVQPREPAGDWRQALRQIRYGLAGVIGNDCHPLDAHILRRHPCHDLGRSPFVVGDLAIIGLPSAPNDEPGGEGLGLNLYTRAQAREHLDRQLRIIEDRPCILVSHTPPFGLLDLAIRFGVSHIGSSVVREVMARPQVKAVVCGHVHSQGERSAEADGCVVVNIASDDHAGAPLRYAVIQWDGHKPQIELGFRRNYHELRRLSGITDNAAEVLAGRGVSQIEQVAAMTPPELGATLGRRSLKEAQRAVAHAQSLLSRIPVVYGNRAWIPDPLILLDVETSLAGDDPWLLGVLPPGEAEVQQFQQLDPSRHIQQLEVLDRFARAHPFALIGSWGNFDRTVFVKLARACGKSPPDWLTTRWVDLCTWLRRQVMFPTDGFTLQDIAGQFGFKWSAEMSGAEAGALYSIYRRDRTPFNVAAVRTYNMEDVQALARVVQSLPTLLGSGVVFESLDERIVNVIDQHGPVSQNAIADHLALSEGSEVVRAALHMLEADGAVGCVRRGYWDLT